MTSLPPNPSCSSAEPTSMELTKNEMEIAEQWISKREKQAAQWPLRRWLILAVYTVSIFIGYRIVKDGMESIRDDKTFNAMVNDTIGAPPAPGLEQRWAVGTQLKIARLLELRQQVVAYSLMEVAAGFLPVLGGVSMMCIVIMRWNTDERDALICKIMRAKLQEFAQTH